jgi:class 3 adenylate cyclase
LYLALRSLGYLVAILTGLAVSAWLLRTSAESEPLIEPDRFVADVTGPIVAQLGTIHKYVGDEIIVTWPLAVGIRDGHCVRACFDALAKLDALADAYVRDFGRRANFRSAALRTRGHR